MGGVGAPMGALELTLEDLRRAWRTLGLVPSTHGWGQRTLATSRGPLGASPAPMGARAVLTAILSPPQARLTCPCCNARKKDAVLTKCFHVFCFECVKSRYDTRQRKCPKCNAAFGAHDFHRVYIS
uniref:E3 ubiquitin protein ligase n=1 Tax=Anas zonorhyncha TaxID=75864 RepID=A0A8B9ZUA5_9AVES